MEFYGGLQRSVNEGQYTSTIYELIAESKHAEVVQILSHELQNFPRSRAALSLLGYCYYQLQDFLMASQMCDIRRKSSLDRSPLDCVDPSGMRS